MYPSLFTSGLPSVCSEDIDSDPTLNDADNESEQTNRKNYVNSSSSPKRASMTLSIDFSSLISSDMIITSDGLCDHVREIFNIDRHEYNIYQVKAMRKLLVTKSHPQVIKKTWPLKSYSCVF